jgi:hypothetical protein
MRWASPDGIMAVENPREGGLTSMRSPPLPVTAAAILLALLSLPSLVFPLLPTEGIPALVVYSGVVLGVAGLAAAAGLWMLKRWSFWLTIVVSVLNLLSAAPGIAAAPNAALQAAATATVVVSGLISVLVVLPASRRALATSYQPSRVR